MQTIYAFLTFTGILTAVGTLNTYEFGDISVGQAFARCAALLALSVACAYKGRLFWWQSKPRTEPSGRRYGNPHCQSVGAAAEDIFGAATPEQ